jgi:hypothetical protein
MKRKPVAVVALLCLSALIASCGSYADVATKALEVTGPATLRAAKAGARLHEIALNDLADELELALKEAECEGESKPAACAEIISAGRERRTVLEDRYTAFEKAILTADAVQAEVAYSVSLYLVNKDKASLVASLGRLIGAWKVLTETMGLWGVNMPKIGG